MCAQYHGRARTEVRKRAAVQELRRGARRRAASYLKLLIIQKTGAGKK
jgi:hypothetical protein